MYQVCFTYIADLLNLSNINYLIYYLQIYIDHDMPKRILIACNKIVKFFKKSHQGKSLLEKYVKDFNIEGGGLKTWVETRWTTMFDAVDSIWRLKLALEKVGIILI